MRLCILLLVSLGFSANFRNGSKCGCEELVKGSYLNPQGLLIETETAFNGGVADGLAYGYYESGKVYFFGKYAKGEANGNSFLYYETGSVKQMTTWNHGVPTGSTCVSPVGKVKKVDISECYW